MPRSGQDNELFKDVPLFTEECDDGNTNNGDGNVDGDDRNILRGALRSCTGGSGFVPEADYDRDGCITYNDYRTWYQHYRDFMNP